MVLKSVLCDCCEFQQDTKTQQNPTETAWVAVRHFQIKFWLINVWISSQWPIHDLSGAMKTDCSLFSGLFVQLYVCNYRQKLAKPVEFTSFKYEHWKQWLKLGWSANNKPNNDTINAVWPVEVLWRMKQRVFVSRVQFLFLPSHGVLPPLQLQVTRTSWICLKVSKRLIIYAWHVQQPYARPVKPKWFFLSFFLFFLIS